jgi:hypothetical protein
MTVAQRFCAERGTVYAKETVGYRLIRCEEPFCVARSANQERLDSLLSYYYYYYYDYSTAGRERGKSL